MSKGSKTSKKKVEVLSINLVPEPYFSSVESKNPQSFSVQRLMPGNKETQQLGDWESQGHSSLSNTTTLDEAIDKQFNGEISNTRSDIYSRWESRSFPQKNKKDPTTHSRLLTPFADALQHILKVNEKEPRLLKIRMLFTDGTSLLLERAKWSDSNSLHFSKLYDPNASFHGKTVSKTQEYQHAIKPFKKEFLCDKNGRTTAREDYFQTVVTEQAKAKLVK